MTNDRETFSYCLEGSRDNIERGMPFLGDVACNPAFKPWEITEIIPRLQLELNNRSHPVRAMENLHKVRDKKLITIDSIFKTIITLLGGFPLRTRQLYLLQEILPQQH